MPNIGPHLLGRVPSPPDPRDFPMDAALDYKYEGLVGAIMAFLRSIFSWLTPAEDPVPPPPPPPDPDAPDMDALVLWKAGAVLSQVDTPHCVGFSGAAWENAEPVPFTFDDEEGHRLYYQCKINDGEPKRENGTWVRSLAEVLQGEGRIGPYYFANDRDGDTALEEVRRWLRAYGPVVFGTDWYDDMFYPDSLGYVSATGEIAGGHAYLCIGDDPDRHTLLFQNSWDDDWGVKGFFRMTYTTAKQLLAAQGEALGTTEVAR